MKPQSGARTADREFGYIVFPSAKESENRRSDTWEDAETLGKIGSWMRVCAGWADQQSLKILRFGEI